MKGLKSFISFKYALRGIVYCIKNERHMRIHIVATIFVILLSLFFDLSNAEYAVLFLTISLVVSLEAVNTAVEELTDMSSNTYDPMARISKDVAAGAVLLSSIFAVAVAVFIFWKPDGFINLFEFIKSNPIWDLFILLLTAACLFFIVAGPVGIKKAVLKIRSKE